MHELTKTPAGLERISRITCITKLLNANSSTLKLILDAIRAIPGRNLFTQLNLQIADSAWPASQINSRLFLPIIDRKAEESTVSRPALLNLMEALQTIDNNSSTQNSYWRGVIKNFYSSPNLDPDELLARFALTYLEAKNAANLESQWISHFKTYLDAVIKNSNLLPNVTIDQKQALVTFRTQLNQA